VRTSAAGIKLVKEFEGCRLKAYFDSVGIATIGYGHTKGVKMGDTCTQTQADAWLVEDLASAESDVERLVKVPITENEHAALVSFVFNLGGKNLAKSTLLVLLNQMKYDLAADQILLWDKAGSRRLPGLTRRRIAERKLFLQGI